MKICENGHSKIVHEGESCPLCRLTKHNLIVHQFIESKEINLVEKLIEYQERRRSDLACQIKTCCYYLDGYRETNCEKYGDINLCKVYTKETTEEQK